MCASYAQNEQEKKRERESMSITVKRVSFYIMARTSVMETRKAIVNGKLLINSAFKQLCKLIVK